MRLVAGSAVITEGVLSVRTGGASGTAILHVLDAGLGILLVAGLWTPIAGVLMAILAVREPFTQTENVWRCILLGTIGVALAMLGPGGWSVDARLFGWKRIDAQDRKK
jgi:uncharacterized membrane protein YphA (DoxX/SURF4 family)